MVDYQALIDRADTWIVDRSRTVVVVFLLVSLVFGFGLTQVSTEAGTSQFTEDSPEQEALEAVNREFTPPFDPENASTQLVQSGRNVLAKPELLAMLTAQHRLEQREVFGSRPPRAPPVSSRGPSTRARPRSRPRFGCWSARPRPR